MKQQVAVIGEGVIDRFVTAAGVKDVIGGSPLNTAVALKRAGVDSHWWARISSTAEGAAIMEYAQINSVLSKGWAVLDLPAPIVTIELDAAGVPTYDFALESAADWAWNTDDFSELKNYAAVQIGSLTSVLEPGASALQNALLELRRNTDRPLISFDPNARPKAAKTSADAERMRNQILRLVELADLVKVSDEDLTWFDAATEPAATAAAWSNLGPKLVVMTRGAEGAAAYHQGEMLAQTPGVKVEVVDTVGAGDTFMAWLLAAVIENGAIPTSLENVQPAIDRAARAAAVTCSRAGCNPPVPGDL